MASQDEFGYELKIPKDRIAVLIGKKGEVKKRLEEATKTELKIDSKEGDVFVSGSDALGLFSAREIIKAVGRGFNPEIAFLLLKGDYVLEIINIPDYVSNKEDLTRIKGRVIGKGGKSRKVIESITECYLSIFGKTVAIIGLADNALLAKKAVEMLLKGSPHSHVYSMLERKRKEAKFE